MTVDEAVELAIENTIVDGLTDIFGDHLEVELLKDTNARRTIKVEVVKALEKKQFNQMGFRQIQHVLVPKSHHAYDYRRAALMQIECHLKYLAVCLLTAEVIESNRIPFSDSVIFSNRFAPNAGRIFSNREHYSLWVHDYVERRKSGKYLVIVQCDISSFFDRINLHRIQSTLESLNVEDWISKAINDILGFWAKKDSYGIPIGSNASRILAEACLIDVDNYLISEGITYSRYVDDFRIFAPDLNTAQQWITKLITKLFKEGLLLNAGKTKFLDCTKEDPKESPTAETAEEVLKVVTRLVGKYNKIPRSFKMPKEEKFHLFRTVDLTKDLEEFRKNPLIEFEKIQKLIIASIVKQEWKVLLECPKIILNCPYGIDYVIDMLMKNGNYIPKEFKAQLSNEFGAFITSKRFQSLDWYETRILRLLSSEDYYNKPVLLAYIQNATKYSSSLPSMTALEGLTVKATRTDAKTIRDLFDHCGPWEQRRIILLVAKVLPEDEKKAWLRSIQPIVGQDTVSAILHGKAMKNAV